MVSESRVLQTFFYFFKVLQDLQIVTPEQRLRLLGLLSRYHPLLPLEPGVALMLQQQARVQPLSVGCCCPFAQVAKVNSAKGRGASLRGVQHCCCR